MRRRYFIAAICITLSGCAAPGQMASHQNFAEAYTRYVNCLGQKAVELTWQPGTPSNLFLIAVNQCKHLRDHYRQEIGPYDKLPLEKKRFLDREPELARLLVETIINVRRGNIEAEFALKRAEEKLDRIKAEVRKLKN